MGKRVLTLDRGRLLDSETPPATPARELAAPAREAPFLPLG
jgi:hypothetical protein